MTGTGTAAHTGVAAMGRAVLPLLAACIFINYVDRGNLATAAPLMKDELGLSATQIGFLISAFFWSYVPAHFLVGWMIDRFNAYRTLALGLALWALATAGIGLAQGFMLIFIMRLLLGIGESAAFPCFSKLLTDHLPPEKLGAANGVITSGMALGPAFGTFFGGMLMAALGWRDLFIFFGLASLAWLIPWMLVTRKASAVASATQAVATVSYREILKRREAWGMALGHFCINYAFYFVISWLPLYLVKSRGFSVTEMAETGGFIYLAYAASCFLTGQLTDRAIARGACPSRVRRGVMMVNSVGAAICLIVAVNGSNSVAIASLFFAAIAFGLASPILFTIAQTLAGPGAAGKWTGFQNAMGNLAGIAGPLVTGFVIDKTGSFTLAFVIAAGVSLTGLIAWGLMVRKVEQLDWGKAAQPG